MVDASAGAQQRGRAGSATRSAADGRTSSCRAAADPVPAGRRERTQAELPRTRNRLPVSGAGLQGRRAGIAGRPRRKQGRSGRTLPGAAHVRSAVPVPMRNRLGRPLTESPLMPLTAHFARRLFLTLLRGEPRAGRALRPRLRGLMVAAPEVPARVFDLPLPPLPEGAFYLWIWPSLAHHARRALPARGPRPAPLQRHRRGGDRRPDPGRRSCSSARRRSRAPGLAGLCPLAAADLAFGLAHAAFWWPIRS